MDIKQSHFPKRFLDFPSPLTKGTVDSRKELIVSWLEGFQTREVLVPNLLISHTPSKYYEAISLIGYLLKFIYAKNLIRENAFYYHVPTLLKQMFKLPEEDEWKLNNAPLIIFDQVGVVMRDQEIRWLSSFCMSRMHNGKPSAYVAIKGHVPESLDTFLSQNISIEITK